MDINFKNLLEYEQVPLNGVMYGRDDIEKIKEANEVSERPSITREGFTIYTITPEKRKGAPLLEALFIRPATEVTISTNEKGRIVSIRVGFSLELGKEIFDSIEKQMENPKVYGPDFARIKEYWLDDQTGKIIVPDETDLEFEAPYITLAWPEQEDKGNARAEE